MHKLILIVLTMLGMLSSITGNEVITDAKKVVCYYGGLTAKDMINLYPEGIDASVCTHITYMHGGINVDLEEVQVTSLFDVPVGTRYTERLVKLKDANPNLKLLLFISPEQMPWVLQTAERRTKIIKSAVAFLNEISFDGLDFPIRSALNYTEDLTAFLCDMKTEFDKHGYILSTATSCNIEASSPNSVIERISRCSSFITVQTIENWTSGTATTTLIAPMNLTRTSIDSCIEKGFSGNKLLITIPTISLIVNLTDPEQTGLGASISGPGTDGSQYTNRHTAFYSTLMKRMNDSSEEWTIVRDEEGSSPYAYSKFGQWVSYEDPISAAAKARFVLEKNLGGTLIFTLDMEDFEGITGKTFPVIRAISDTFKQSVRVSSDSQ